MPPTPRPIPSLPQNLPAVCAANCPKTSAQAASSPRPNPRPLRAGRTRVEGLAFGGMIYRQIKALPTHRSMAEVSELIYATCKTYMLTQGKFLLFLELFIALIILAYFGGVQQLGAGEAVDVLAHNPRRKNASVHCRIGSSEMLPPARVVDVLVHCRIGSSEMHALLVAW